MFLLWGLSALIAAFGAGVSLKLEGRNYMLLRNMLRFCENGRAMANKLF
jgi:hypothetical protein